MEKVESPGAGERSCNTTKYTRVQLKNTPIVLERDVVFIYEICTSLNVKLYQLRLFTDHKHKYGICNYTTKEVILYRHDVSTLLHEYAHAIRRELCGGAGHDRKFCDLLDMLITIWIGKFNQKGQNLTF